MGLLCGQLVRLVAPDPEADPALESVWTNDAEFLRLFDLRPARPRSAAEIKRAKEKWLLESEPKPNEFAFMIRALDGDRPIGMTDLYVPHWAHRDAWLGIGLGDREYWGKGYGTDAVRVVLRYAFTELGLERVSLDVFAYNERAARAYLKAGFREEGRQRERLRRDGRRWDMIYMGIMREEWEGMEV